MILTDKEILRAIPGLLDCLSDPYDKFETGDNHGSIPYDMIRLGRAVEAMVVLRTQQELVALKDELEILKVYGPQLERATCMDGTIKMGSMLDVLNDYRMAAETEAHEVDRLNSEIDKFKEAIEHLVKARDKKLYLPSGDLSGHHYLAIEERQRGITKAMASLESLIVNVKE